MAVAEGDMQVARRRRRSLAATLSRHLAWGVVTIFLVSVVTFFGSSLKSPTELAQASLGRFITSGLTLLDYSLLFVGAIPIAILALFAEASLAGVERLVTPPAAP